MRKRISIEQLTVGMQIEKLDRSWLSTPFLRNRFIVTTVQQIEQLRACGVRQIEVDVDEAVLDGGSIEPVLTAEIASPSPEVQPADVSSPPATTFTEELHAAKQAYHAAKGVIQQAMEDVRMGDALNMDAVQQVVEGMADSILRNPDALTSLSRLKQFDEYTFYHSVNTSLLALSLGRDLGYARPQLMQLGTGMLLHDIGKTKIPLEILNKPGRYEAHEFEIMKQHVMRGAEVLSETTGLSDMFLKPTMEHHERVDGTGYPNQRGKTEISEYGLIASIVDIYDAVTSDRCYHKGKSPHETLQMLFQLGRRGHVDSVMVQRFVRVVGVYPVGSYVSLNTCETAIVIEVNHQAPMKPRVLIVSDRNGGRLMRPLELDLATQSGQFDRTIDGTLDPETAGIDMSLYLDARAA
ncbi:MAG: HD-GYP domain-containing protein [Nitrospira sp.]|nr:HD-GYP domain-containing protein [Nitrospira sp.]